MVNLLSQDIRVRADAKQIKESLLSASMIAWQSMGGKATRIIVKMKDVLLDDITSNPQAESLQGGLPPRQYA